MIKRTVLYVLIFMGFQISSVHAGIGSEIIGTASMDIDPQGQKPGSIENRNILIIGVRSARIREKPSFKAAVEYGLEKDDVVKLLIKKDEWRYVERDDGKRGWGHESIFLVQEEYQEPLKYQEELQIAESRIVEPSPDAQADKSQEQGADSVKEKTGNLSESDMSENQVRKSDISIQWMDDETLSVNFLDVDIREALSALALEREINVATSVDVTGNITVHLYNSTLDQALEAITLAGGFSYVKKGSLYYVFKPREARDPQEGALRMRIFRLKYAEIDKVQEILNGMPDLRPVKIHDASKTIITEDTPENIEKIEKIIAQWDRMPRQVMIEAKILEITLTDSMSFGVNWGDILGDARVGTGGLSTATMPTTAPVSPVPTNGKGIFFNLITAAGTDEQFTAALDALQTKTKINTLSTPKILAIHGRPAKVQVGGQQGYTVTTTNEGVSTETIEFIDTGTILQITPFIDDDDNVLLDVRPSIRSARIEGGIPVVNSTEVSTWLTAKNGETVFIGGLIQDTKTKTKDMVPCLGGFPGVGALFGRTTSGIGKSELVVLITPNIIDAGKLQSEKSVLEKVGQAEEKLKNEPLSPEGRIRDILSPD